MAQPFSEQSATAYFEAVIAAILASNMIGAAKETPEDMIVLYKKMLQKLRATEGGAFN